MLNLDESVQKMPSKGQAAAETEYTAPDFDPKGLSYYKIQHEVGKTLSSKEH